MAAQNGNTNGTTNGTTRGVDKDDLVMPVGKDKTLRTFVSRRC
jgi:hypothetical protein